VFWDEVSNKGNYKYSFGDPVKQEDGSYLYPEFAGFFKEYGESYLEQNIRLYKSIVKLYNNMDRLQKTKFVVITHGASLAIYKEMELIAHQLVNDGFDPEVGTIMDLTWEYFKKRPYDIASKYGHIETIDVTPLLNLQVIDRLKLEISYMEEIV